MCKSGALMDPMASQDKENFVNKFTALSNIYHEIEGLTKADNLVLKKSCEYIIENDALRVDPEAVFADGGVLGLFRSEIKECISILEEHGYLHVAQNLGNDGDGYSCHYQVTHHGLSHYAESYIPDYYVILDNVIRLIVNGSAHNNVSIQEKMNIPIVIINYILDTLASRDHIKLSKTTSGRVQIYNLSV